MNRRIAAWSLLLLAASLALSPALDPGVGAARPLAPPAGKWFTEATIARNLVTLKLAGDLDARGLDPASFRLRVNGGPPLAPLEVTGEPGASPELRLRFPEGAGSGDAASLLLPDPGAPDGQGEVALATATPPGDLPAGRAFVQAVPDASGFAYLLGGSATVTPTGAAGAPVDTIVRVHLATGETRTMGARLPSPRLLSGAAWSNASTDACPTGCIYLFGGEDASGAPLAEVLRYDPARDRVERIVAAMPTPRRNPLALATGPDIHVLGADPTILRFSPASETFTVIGASALTAAEALSGVFDPHPSPGCPEGCGYLFGPGDVVPESTQAPVAGSDSHVTVRFDPSSGAVGPAPNAKRYPEAPDAAVWAGTRAYLFGGRSCPLSMCIGTTTVWRFVPADPVIQPEAAGMPVSLRGATALAHGGEIVVLGAIVGGRPLTEGPLEQVIRYPIP